MKRTAINWAGLVAVGAAAAILTFNTLQHLAESCGFTGWLAWLFPISVDAAGAVATNVWLTGKDSHAAVRFARTWAITAAAVSLLGNGTQHGLDAYGVAAPWWVAVAVAVVPPLALVGTVHLMVLLSQAETPLEVPVSAPAQKLATPSPVPVPPPTVPAAKVLYHQEDDLFVKAQRYIAEHGRVGRGVLARELGVSEHQARQLLASTNGNGRH